MKFGEKIRCYLESNGLQSRWFAEKLGISKAYFYNILAGRASLPKKQWKLIIEMTKGEITLYDILTDYFSEIEDIEFHDRGEIYSCIIALKNINKGK